MSELYNERFDNERSRSSTVNGRASHQSSPSENENAPLLHHQRPSPTIERQLEVNERGWDLPQSPHSIHNNNEVDAFETDLEPHRGVKRELGPIQIFVRREQELYN